MSINELESEQKDWALSMLCRSGVLSLDWPPESPDNQYHLNK